MLRVVGLMAMDSSIFGGAGSSDPQVRINIDGFHVQKTKFIRKTLSPSWNEKIVFPYVLDQALSMKITVEDHNDIKPTCDFMGRISLQLSEFYDKKPSKNIWFLFLCLGNLLVLHACGFVFHVLLCV